MFFAHFHLVVFILTVTLPMCVTVECVEVASIEGWNAWPGHGRPPPAAVIGCWSAWCCWACSLGEDTQCNETTEWPRWPSSSPWRCVYPHRNEARSQRAGRNGWAPARERRWRLKVFFFCCFFSQPHILLHSLHLTYCFVKVCQAELFRFWKEFSLMHKTNVENDVCSFLNARAFDVVVFQSSPHYEINHRMKPQTLIDETLQHFQTLVVNVFCSFITCK